MAFESDIQRQEFNEITMAREYSYQIGLLLEDKLGKMLVEASNYYPTGNTVAEGLVYSVDLSVVDVTDNTVYPYIPTYTALAGDGVTEVLAGLAQWVTDNASDHLITNVYTVYTTDVDKHMFFVPKDGFTSTENSKTNLSSDPTKVWTPSDTPACYIGYGKQPAAEYPRIIVTPMVSTTVCNKMEESVMLVEGVPTEYTSSYIDFSMNLTAEAGDTDEVLKTGISAQSLLNDLRRRFVNEIMRKRIQNAMNSAYHAIESILPLPLIEATQYMSIARCTSKWSTIDVLFPEVEAGYMEAVEFVGSTPEDPNGIIYKYDEDGEVVIYGEGFTVDRRDLLYVSYGYVDPEYVL